MPVYFFDIKAARESSKLMGLLYKRGTPINSADVMIAGTAIANGAEGVITKDRDFERIHEICDLDIYFI